MMIHCSKVNKCQKSKIDNPQEVVGEIIQALVAVGVVVVAMYKPNKLKVMMHNCKLDKHNSSKFSNKHLQQLMHKIHVAPQ